MINFLRRLFDRTHRHEWQGSCWNKYCHDVEQHCRWCGAYRHAPTFADYRDDRWTDGPHPTAQALRQGELEQAQP